MTATGQGRNYWRHRELVRAFVGELFSSPEVEALPSFREMVDTMAARTDKDDLTGEELRELAGIVGRLSQEAAERGLSSLPVPEGEELERWLLALEVVET